MLGCTHPQTFIKFSVANKVGKGHSSQSSRLDQPFSLRWTSKADQQTGSVTYCAVVWPKMQQQKQVKDYF